MTMKKIDLEKLEELLIKQYSASRIIKFHNQFLKAVKMDPELEASLEDSFLINSPVKLIKQTRVGSYGFEKNGQPSVNGLREFLKISGSSEFYPQGIYKGLNLIHASLTAYFLLAVQPLMAGPMDAPEKFLKDAFEYWINSPTSMEKELLDHIKIRYSGYYDSAGKKRLRDRLFMPLGKISSKRWIDVNHILTHCILRGIRLTDFHLQELRYSTFEKTNYGSWKTEKTIGRATAPNVLYLPVLNVFFFMAAGLGLVEICYDYPRGTKESQTDNDYEYFTPYNGLRYVRLTALGKYVSGKSDDYKYKTDTDKAKIILDESRLILAMQGDNPVMKIAIEKIMEPVGRHRYRMTFASLFRGCKTRKDILNNINLFRDYICGKPPEVWENFFKKALNRIRPLKKETVLDIFSISQDKELMNILASDPKITPLILKVEGRRIAIRKEDMKKRT